MKSDYKISRDVKSNSTYTNIFDMMHKKIFYDMNKANISKVDFLNFKGSVDLLLSEFMPIL